MVGVAEAFDAVGTLAEILIEHGPLSEDEITERLQHSGADDPEAIMDELLDEMACPARQLLDDRWFWLPAVLLGRVFTHRLDATEVAHDILAVTPDLLLIGEVCEYEDYAHYADGSPAEVAHPGFDDELLEQRGIPAELIGSHAWLLLPSGMLANLDAGEGDLIGVGLTENGLVVERVTAGAHTAVAERLAATFDDEPVYLGAAVWTICAEDPTVFTEPLAPLYEIIDDNGLTRDGDWLGPEGFDFDTWRFERGCTMLAERHDLDPDDAFALYTLVKLFEEVAALIEAVDVDESPAEALGTVWKGATGAGETTAELHNLRELVDLVGELGVVLADPTLAELLVGETIGTGREGAPALALFAEIIGPKVPRAALVGVRWLRAVALERVGAVDACERELLAAESMDPNWPLALFDLARFASDRGDAERGLALLRRAGAGPDHPLMRVLERHRTEPRRDIGRNALCWCGSGRKYKKCHLGREQQPLAERVGWLYVKAGEHAVASGWTEAVAEVACERCRYADDFSAALDAALEDPLVTDAVLFEGGAFEEFVELRGHLLPDDERQLAEQWLAVHRSVFEVEDVHRGHGITVRDVRTGDVHEVSERTASRQLKPGQLICARVVPTGDTMQIFGGIEPVALHERDSLIELLDTEPDPVTLVAQLSRRFAPPELVNTEGDLLAMCEATVQVSDPAGIEAALDDTYDRVEDYEPPQWIEHVTTQGMPRVRASLVLDGPTLRVQTNSETRMDRVLTTLARLDPTMNLVEDSRRPIHDVREAAKLAGQLPTSDEGDEGALDPDDPEVAAMLDEFIRDYETKWLDEPIPALNGCSPREAADDPTRRGDLIKLLDSFPTEARRGTMDVSRLRAALGL
ncbi:SEC-C metal-binding domain-containing protein [Mycobacterium bourgelatii]